jgi:hypothetical protein
MTIYHTFSPARSGDDHIDAIQSSDVAKGINLQIRPDVPEVDEQDSADQSYPEVSPQTTSSGQKSVMRILARAAIGTSAAPRC